MTDFIIIGGICLCLGLISFYLIKRKKEGKSGCACGGCQHCNASGCGKLPLETKKKE